MTTAANRLLDQTINQLLTALSVDDLQAAERLFEKGSRLLTLTINQGGKTMSDAAFTSCDICGQEIHYGEDFHEITLSREEHNSGSITPTEVNELLTMCSKCKSTAKLDFPDFDSILNSMKSKTYFRLHEVKSPDEKQVIENSGDDICAGCETILKDGERYSINSESTKVHWNELHKISDMTISDSMLIAYLCCDCTAQLDINDLTQEITKTLDIA
jgi:hypothetical protein